MTFSGIHPETAADILVRRIRQAILVGDLPAGGRLVEQSLAEQFGVSRGPVRESVRRLAAEGLVVLRTNRSAIVAEPTFDDLVEVYGVRSSIGALAIEHAVAINAIGSHNRGRFQAHLQRMAEFDPVTDQAEMVVVDLQFQSELIRAAALPRVSAIFDKTAIDVQFFVTALDVFYDTVSNDQLIQRHRDLMTLIERGDAAGAKAAWARHMDASVQDFVRVFDQRDVVLERPRLLGIIARA